jgi:hypothetical protein
MILRRKCVIRVVRLIPDDSGFGLGISGYNFRLSISVCQRVHRGVRNICRVRPSFFLYFSGDIDKVTRRYSRRLNLLSRSEIIIGSEIITGVSPQFPSPKPESSGIRLTHHSYTSYSIIRHQTSGGQAVESRNHERRTIALAMQGASTPTVWLTGLPADMSQSFEQKWGRARHI